MKKYLFMFVAAVAMVATSLSLVSCGDDDTVTLYTCTTSTTVSDPKNEISSIHDLKLADMQSAFKDLDVSMTNVDETTFNTKITAHAASVDELMVGYIAKYPDLANSNITVTVTYIGYSGNKSTSVTFKEAAAKLIVK